jgi:hypothetical protein
VIGCPVSVTGSCASPFPPALGAAPRGILAPARGRDSCPRPYGLFPSCGRGSAKSPVTDTGQPSLGGWRQGSSSRLALIPASLTNGVGWCERRGSGDLVYVSWPVSVTGELCGVTLGR